MLTPAADRYGSYSHCAAPDILPDFATVRHADDASRLAVRYAVRRRRRVSLPSRHYVRKRDRPLETWQAIYLHVACGYGVSEIASRLQLDNRTVKERLRFGREQHWWSIDINAAAFPREQVLSSLYPLQEVRPLARRLGRRHVSPALRQVFVFDDPALPHPDGESTPEQWARRIEAFGLAAGVFLSRRLDRGVTTVGVGWGETTSAVVDGIAVASRAAVQRSSPVECVATVGELVGETRANPDLSSSGLAERLSRHLNGTPEHSHTLRGVPALIPFSVPLEDVEICLKMIRGYENHQRVFGVNGLARRMQCVITSAGNPNQRNKYWRRELERAAIRQTLVDQLNICDIGGALIPDARMAGEGRRLFEELQVRSVGLTAAEYRGLAASASASTSPGVVLCCLDHNKADVVAQCLADNLVNILIVDRSLATALA